MHSCTYWMSKTLNSRKSLYYTQTPPDILLEGWSDRTELWTWISKLPSFGATPELKYVSDKQIMSNLWTAINAFREDNFV